VKLLIGFQRGGRIARDHVPELDQELAGDGGDGDNCGCLFSGEESARDVDQILSVAQRRLLHDFIPQMDAG
jgi:hypothetical protein